MSSTWPRSPRSAAATAMAAQFRRLCVWLWVAFKPLRTRSALACSCRSTVASGYRAAAAATSGPAKLSG